jgi:methyltransferase
MLKPVAGVSLVALQRLLELRLSRRNEHILRSRGAVERGGGHYPLIVATHALWLLSTLAEDARRKERIHLLPLAIFLAAQLLRYWAILSLGERWCTRILVLPGEELVRSGPYRYIKHPNYLAVATEILAFPLLFGARNTAIVFSVLNAALLRVRIAEEERALRELAKPPAGG